MDDDIWPVNFGALPSLPDGYRVVQLDSGHYMGENETLDWETCITVNKWHARTWCIHHAAFIGPPNPSVRNGGYQLPHR